MVLSLTASDTVLTMPSLLWGKLKRMSGLSGTPGAKVGVTMDISLWVMVTVVESALLVLYLS